ncbi:hypothetical protein HPB47_020547 [Ixodes persulcatus]|uniref:Uncharacterized protein n=1 Tax=Ixodes persulcatus TaxID=34615 RepID=A0AC60QH94_IXOPE|nr:hypothetical protein HPB47_020547 [Ixodes persulcatus]
MLASKVSVLTVASYTVEELLEGACPVLLPRRTLVETTPLASFRFAFTSWKGLSKQDTYMDAEPKFGVGKTRPQER